MIKKLVFALILISTTVQSQNFVKGTMSPVIEDLEWVILYQLKGAKQIYIANTAIENGKFQLNFLENSPKGMYRLTYDMNNGGFVDILYNNENIELKFDPTFPSGTLEIITSEENKLYTNYHLQTDAIKQQLDSLQLSYFRLNDETAMKFTGEYYKKTLENYYELQNNFELKSKNQLANHFIKSNKKYYSPEVFSTPQEYLNSEKLHYFDFINFDDAVLQNSIFYTEKIVDYVFYLNRSDDIDVQNGLYKSAINDVAKKMGDNYSLTSATLTTLMYNFAQLENIVIIDYIIENLYKKLPVSYQNAKDVEAIQEMVKLAIGKKAPDFTWKENNTTKSLYEANEASTYILVFWSTTCSHCLNEVPQLYDYIKENKNVKVIAIALENDELGFKHYTENFINWTNVLGLNKWQNKIAKEYKIVSTPSYFILDSNKKILSKPEYFEDIKAYFEK